MRLDHHPEAGALEALRCGDNGAALLGSEAIAVHHLLWADRKTDIGETGLSQGGDRRIVHVAAQAAWAAIRWKAEPMRDIDAARQDRHASWRRLRPGDRHDCQ